MLHFAQSEKNLPQTANIQRVAVLVLDQTNTLGLAAAIDPLRAANRHAGRRLYDWRLTTPENRPVALTSGLDVPAAPLSREARCDILLVAASFALDAQCTQTLLASLRRLAHHADHVIGIDGGPWVLARAGLLNGHRATTHWEDLEGFATRFPEVDTVNARYQISGSRMTAGGARPTLDMMLNLIARSHGDALAQKVAASFILDDPTEGSRPQTRRPSRQNHTRITARAQALMETTLDNPLPLSGIAKALGLSPRALQLQFRTHLGTTPRAHYLSLRLAEAERLVTQTDRALHDIALSTGFASQSSFARAYAAAHGTSARAHRARTT